MPDTAPLNRTKMINAATRSTRLSQFRTFFTIVENFVYTMVTISQYRRTINAEIDRIPVHQGE